MKLYKKKILEMATPKGARVAAFITRKNEYDDTEILLIQKLSDNEFFPIIYEIPRIICKEEDMNSCVIRGVKEETGLDVRVIEFLGKINYISDKGVESTQYNFLCEPIDRNQRIVLPNRRDEYEWDVDCGELELLMAHELRKTVIDVLNRGGGRFGHFSVGQSYNMPFDFNKVMNIYKNH